MVPGDAIVLVHASGIHANGLSLARKLVERLPQGWQTEVEPGLSYGAALLAPTPLYSPLLERLWQEGIVPRYCANITGHGWRKLMRHPRELTYRIHTLPPAPTVLRFIQQQAGLDDQEAYGTLNMGAGFALYLPAEAAATAVDWACRLGYGATLAGQVEPGPKRLIVEPLDLCFAGSDLALR
jgi:phosphoribosylformylglycinamidine cyclo-ligase